MINHDLKKIKKDYIFEACYIKTEYYNCYPKKRVMLINAKLKMHKNANSKCTILAKHRLEEYTSPGRCEYERAKGHFREGEAFNEREF